MQYGFCHLNCVAVRKENNDASEMVTQLLFGDHFQILEQQKKWIRIRLAFDFYEGWIDKKQYRALSPEAYQTYTKTNNRFLIDLVDYATYSNGSLMPLSIGANLKAAPLMELQCDGLAADQKLPKDQFVDIAGYYLNTPYLWGGKTPFGIDCSGFTQMVYKIAGYRILRDASQQARQGFSLSFVEESEPGDLAFFDNQDGDIIHVGILMNDNYIIHAHGHVRIDRLDQSGIFNVDTKTHSHRLRLIKKIV